MLNRRNTGLLALAALGLTLAPTIAVAQDHAAEGPTEEQIEARKAMVTAVVQAVLAETDFDAVKAHVVAAMREHSAEIGGDTEAAIAHVSQFIDQVAARSASDPHGAAEFTATMLIEAHSQH